MLYCVHAVFKPGAEAVRDARHQAFNAHLSQPFRHIRLAGGLRSETGERLGILMLLEADTRAQVDHFLQTSPYLDLYETTRIDLLDLEVGRLG